MVVESIILFIRQLVSSLMRIHFRLAQSVKRNYGLDAV